MSSQSASWRNLIASTAISLITSWREVQSSGGQKETAKPHKHLHHASNPAFIDLLPNNSSAVSGSSPRHKIPDEQTRHDATIIGPWQHSGAPRTSVYQKKKNCPPNKRRNTLPKKRKEAMQCLLQREPVRPTGGHCGHLALYRWMDWASTSGRAVLPARNREVRSCGRCSQRRRNAAGVSCQQSIVNQAEQTT